MGSPNGSRLVLVTLYGGNDGLNTVIPYRDPAYAAARGPLAVDPSSVLPLADGFGLHPAMPGFKKLWDAKELAIVHGVGFADPNYSHFESMDIWQSGVTGLARVHGMAWPLARRHTLEPPARHCAGSDRAHRAVGRAGPGRGHSRRAAGLAGHAHWSRRSMPQWPGGIPETPPCWPRQPSSDSVLLELHQSLGPILDRSDSSNPLHLSGESTAVAGAAGEPGDRQRRRRAGRRTTSSRCSSALWPT